MGFSKFTTSCAATPQPMIASRTKINPIVTSVSFFSRVCNAYSNLVWRSRSCYARLIRTCSPALTPNEEEVLHDNLYHGFATCFSGTQLVRNPRLNPACSPNKEACCMRQDGVQNGCFCFGTGSFGTN